MTQSALPCPALPFPKICINLEHQKAAVARSRCLTAFFRKDRAHRLCSWALHVAEMLCKTSSEFHKHNTTEPCSSVAGLLFHLLINLAKRNALLFAQDHLLVGLPFFKCHHSSYYTPPYSHCLLRFYMITSTIIYSAITSDEGMGDGLKIKQTLIPQVPGSRGASWDPCQKP